MLHRSRTFAVLVVLLVVYVGALFAFDSKNKVFESIPAYLSALPVLVGLSFLSYVLRYLRWHWLLSRAGHSIQFQMGFLSYLAGFALTATPGKVGELLRARYFKVQGVPPWRVLSAFAYERVLDLLVVLGLAAVAISHPKSFVFALAFVVGCLVAVVIAAHSPQFLEKASHFLLVRKWHRLGNLLRLAKDGLMGCRTWFTALDLSVSLTLGVLAWSLTAFSFVWLLWQLDVTLPIELALAIYPLAMLVGAASLIPGGMGSTEASIVTLLFFAGVPLAVGALAAVGIRLTSLWLAILCGLISMSILENVLPPNDISEKEKR
jgi:uncharacterized protein (TIRG00374 family)